MSQIEDVLRIEAPIEEGLLAERVSTAWGLQRVTGRVLARLRDLIPPSKETWSADGTRRFLWRGDQDPSAYTEFRLPLPGEPAPRAADRIPAIEIACAARAILRDHVRMDQSSLARELCRIFGFARMGHRVEAAMSEGIRELVSSGGAFDAAGQLGLSP
ncbi:MAG: DUF3320 domain-containing protein [Planctomycetia bacterium]|nr:DUF3320 domain-containing protein [Planctomycetia bacterium]